MDRSEDLKQVRDLHLVRDERDREVEAAAGLRAGNAVVLVSQLLSAVCLLQDDPAWMALLSLIRALRLTDLSKLMTAADRTRRGSIWCGAC